MKIFEQLTEYRSALANIDNADSNHKQVLESIKLLSEQIAVQELQAKKFVAEKSEAMKIVEDMEKAIEWSINELLDCFKALQTSNNVLEMRWFSNDEEQKELMDKFREEDEMIDQINKLNQFFPKVDFWVEKRSRQYIFKPQEAVEILSSDQSESWK